MSMYQISAVTVANEIGLFQHLDSQPFSIGKISEMLKINLLGTKALVNVLVALKFLKIKKDHIRLTPTAQSYLLRDSAFYWGAQFNSLSDRSEHKRLLTALKLSSTQLSHENKTFSAMWEEGTITEIAARDFTEKMQATILAPAVGAIRSGVFSSTKKLLDMGGGSGCFSIAYIEKYPEYHSAVFELPVVSKITSEYVSKSNLNHKIDIIQGNFFKDQWPREFDGILLSQILHDWPMSYCKTLVEYAYKALPQNGKVYIHEMLLEEDQTSPLTTACFNLLMFVNHQSQQFTKNQIFDFLLSAGFKNPKVKKTFGYYSVITAMK